MKSKKILLLTDDLFPGGVARIVTIIANGLSEQGHLVTVAATEGAFRKYLNPSVLFVPLWLEKRNSQRKNILGVIPSYMRLWRLITTSHFDIIHSHQRYSQFIVSSLVHKKQIHITHHHTIFVNKKYFTVFGSTSICCSESVRKNLITKFGCPADRAKTIYNGIVCPLSSVADDEKMEYRKRLNISPDTKIISSIGHFLPMKDRPNLIRAIHLYVHKNLQKDIKVILMGYGDQEAELKELVKLLRLEDIIIFVHGTEDVRKIIEVSAFMILNSNAGEGFGIVLLEAASLGKMHIGTRVGGIPEFIEHEITGMLVQPEDPEELAGAIAFCIDNPDKVEVMGRNARKKFEALFTKEKMIGNILSFYEECIETNSN